MASVAAEHVPNINRRRLAKHINETGRDLSEAKVKDVTVDKSKWPGEEFTLLQENMYYVMVEKTEDSPLKNGSGVRRR